MKKKKKKRLIFSLVEKNLLTVWFWKNKCVRDGCEDSNLNFS